MIRFEWLPRLQRYRQTVFARAIYTHPSLCDLPAAMLDPEVEQLEARVHRLIDALRQSRLEHQRVVQERDRLLALNAELRRRIEGIVDRVRCLETESEPQA